MNEEKIVITGMGAVTPIGIGVENFWEQLINGACGIGPLTRFDASGMNVQIGAEVKNFKAEDYIPKRLIRELDLFMQYAYAAADEAIKDSAMDIEPDRTGIVMATAMNGVATIASTQTQMENSKSGNVSPRFVPKILGNVAAAQISIAHHIQGPSLTVSTACSSGGDAVLMGAAMLQGGMCESVVVVGGEASLCPLVMQSLSGAHALSRNNEHPEKACRPFDADRDGFIMGEGGGAIILETESHAKARGARIYAELAGYANNTDAYHVTAPNPDGSGAAACMKKAMVSAGINPSQIDYINAHGTSTPAGDIAETKAIKAAMGEVAYKVCVSSTKGATGHMMGAGGIIEVFACVKALCTQTVPPTINLENADPECDLDYVPNTARTKDMTYAMSNAFGFGGQNSSIILKRI